MPSRRPRQERALAQLAAELGQQYALAASVLIDAGNAWSGALIVCCGIDAFAALAAGRAVPFGSGSEFVAFVKRYMPLFGPPPPGRLAWTSAPNRPVESCAEVLYRGYRCGLVHEGLTAPGLTIVDKEGPIFVLRTDRLNGKVAYRMDLNVRPFRDCFLQATAEYVRDLDLDHELLDRFRQRWGSITEPQWVLAGT